MKRSIGIVGAGFSGAVIGHLLATSGYEVTVFERRSHLGGNCHTERDPETGVMMHMYGPHVFHTSNEKVWEFVSQFDEFMPFSNRVKAITQGRVFPLPINLLTINQFFGKTFSPREAAQFLAIKADSSIAEPRNFEEQALKSVGRELYEAFFKEYTIKQWGVDPRHLPASILKRLPIRFNYDDNYYLSSHQGVPRHGYTYLVEKLLDHPRISISINTIFQRGQTKNYDHVFYSGPIDAWFDFQEGRLGYRTLDFVSERCNGDFQGNAVVNYCDQSVPWTRISEHKHFFPWESHAGSIISREYSRFCEVTDLPCYPIRLESDRLLLKRYRLLAENESNVTFIGRLGTYRYLDMHLAIAEAMETASQFMQAEVHNESMPAFMANQPD